MSGKGSFAVSRSHGGDIFYNPPAVRRKQQLLLQQQRLMHQQQQQAAVKTESIALAEAGNRSESDDSNAALSKRDSVVSPPVRTPVDVTNLDRLMESVTPFISAQCESEANARGWRMQKAVSPPFYFLEDLWESLKEWSVYGAGVPLVLNEKDQIIQYYVPYLSGMQLYIDAKKPPSRLRRSGEENDAESSMETRSAGSSCESDGCSKSIEDGSRKQQNLMNSNSQHPNKLVLRDKSVISSSSDEAEISNSPGLLLFEYLEQEQPHNRRPLTDKISVLATQFPELKKYKSCDLLPASWMCIAWYPIYRIPIGPTLHDLDASFLTFHSLSTQSSRSNISPQFHDANTRQVRGIVDPSSKISLPVFGLASYKLSGSILSPCAAHEREQENSLFQAAGNWLRALQVILPDYQFFLAHYSQWR